MKKLIFILGLFLLFTSCLDDIGVCKVYCLRNKEKIDTVLFVNIEYISSTKTYVEYYFINELNQIQNLRTDTIEDLSTKLEVYIETNEIK